MNPRREYLLTLLVVIVGSLITWWVYSRTWEPAASCFGSLGPACEPARTGAEVEPTGPAVALLTALTTLAVIPTRGRGRQVVGFLLVLLSVASVVVAVSARANNSVWWLVAVAGSIVALLGSAVVLLRGAGWPTMSSRYERTSLESTNLLSTASGALGVPTEIEPKDAWDALEHGIDPTLT